MNMLDHCFLIHLLDGKLTHLIYRTLVLVEFWAVICRLVLLVVLILLAAQAVLETLKEAIRTEERIIRSGPRRQIIARNKSWRRKVFIHRMCCLLKRGSCPPEESHVLEARMES